MLRFVDGQIVSSGFDEIEKATAAGGSWTAPGYEHVSSAAPAGPIPSDSKSMWSRTKTNRCLAAHTAIVGAIYGEGTFGVSGGGMMAVTAPGEAEGPQLRDIFISHEPTEREWNIQVSSNIELVDAADCPAKAIAIVEEALAKLRSTDIMPFKCRKCKKPCKALKCSRCKKATYCSKACQKSDWKRHKAHCKSKD